MFERECPTDEDWFTGHFGSKGLFGVIAASPEWSALLLESIGPRLVVIGPW